MPNGKPLSGASGAAEFASSAIAFRRIDYWLKPRRKAVCGLDQKAPLPTTYIARSRCRRKWTSGRRTRRRRVRQEPSSVSFRQPHAPISTGLFLLARSAPLLVVLPAFGRGGEFAHGVPRLSPPGESIKDDSY